MSLPRFPLVVITLEGLDAVDLERVSFCGRTPWIRSKIAQSGVRSLRSVMPSTPEANFASLLTMSKASDHGVVGRRVFDPVAGVYRDGDLTVRESILASVQQFGGNVLSVSAEEYFSRACRQGLSFFEGDPDLFRRRDVEGSPRRRREDGKRRRRKPKNEALSSSNDQVTEANAPPPAVDSAGGADGVSLESLAKAAARRPSTMGRAASFSLQALSRAQAGSNGLDGQGMLRELSRAYGSAKWKSRKGVALRDDSEALCQAFSLAFRLLSPSLSVLKTSCPVALAMPDSPINWARYLSPLDQMLADLECLGAAVWLVSMSSHENCRQTEEGDPAIIRLDRLIEDFGFGGNRLSHIDNESVRLRAMGSGSVEPYTRVSGVAGVFLPGRLKQDQRFYRDFIEYLLWESGVSQIMSSDRAHRQFGIPLDALGDMVILADSGWVFVNNSEDEELARKTLPLRSSGSLGTQDLAFLGCGRIEDFALGQDVFGVHDLWRLLRDPMA